MARRLGRGAHARGGHPPRDRGGAARFAPPRVRRAAVVRAAARAERRDPVPPGGVPRRALAGPRRLRPFRAAGVLRGGLAGGAAAVIKALAFDVFGTVVDWRGAVIREGELVAKEKGLRVDWPKFADAWRAGYHPAMDRVRKGKLPWTHIDQLHRMILNDLLKPFGLGGLSEEEIQHLNR